LADKLRQQQLQSEEDSRWLHQEENNLVSEQILKPVAQDLISIKVF
jgi:hypothetical protein